MQVTLIRHTRVNVPKDILYGQLDVGLADSFPQEAEAYRQQLPRDFDAVFSSPLTRCKRLAETLEYTAIEFDERLMEYNFGNWEGLRREEIDPNIFKRTKQGFGIPVKYWLKNELKVLVDTHLSPEQINNRGFFSPVFVSQLINEHNKGIADHTHKIWALLWFEIWCKKYYY